MDKSIFSPSPDTVHLVVKSALLVFAAFYCAFSVIMYAQIGKLEGWLMSLKLFSFKKWMKWHMVLAGAGFLSGLVLF